MMDPFEESNLLYQEDITNLTPDRIMKFIFHHHEYQLPRLKNLIDITRARTKAFYSHSHGALRLASQIIEPFIHSASTLLISRLPIQSVIQ